MASGIKLTYFDLRARGEPIRLALALADVKYEDNRVALETWGQQKPTHKPFNCLPYMEYKGKKYGESMAIANFIARENGLFGSNNLDALRIDEVSGTCADFISAIFNHTVLAKQCDKASELTKLMESDAPRYLGTLTRLLQENGSNGHFVGTELTLADLYAYNVLDSLAAAKAEAAQTWSTELQKLRKAVESHPRLNAYIKNRPQAKF